MIVTNLVATAVSYVLPFGDTNRINELETQQEKDRKRLDELERKFNMSETIQQGIINSLDVLTKQVYENSRKIQHLSDVMPRIMWTGAYQQGTIQEAGARLEAIIHAYQKGQAATKHMAILYNMTELKNINQKIRFWRKSLGSRTQR